MNSSYWPATSEVDRCIRAEAEELAESTLLAVHEPMHLRRVLAGETAGEVVPETSLLEHVIQTNRPTPIIGDSGFGKSHIIRWLHAQLQSRINTDDWHIVRIGKNSSLRQALETLLENLEGDVFDDARSKIASVGQGLKTRDVAEHLVVFISSRLEELYVDARKSTIESDSRGDSLSQEEKNRISMVRRHAKRNGLPSLLGDSNFKKELVEEGKCFFQIAKRITEGSNDDEIDENRYQVNLSDLDIMTNLNNLSLDAKNYVRNAQISTSEPMRQEAIDLLNECLTDACRKTFQQLFQFHGGSFQDLFYEIRKYLKREGKTLFVLVEDMAAISAIEDILIDSLMQEDVRDGVQVLCPLHSVIAVTTGYQGYQRRQDTLRTRTKYEWYIDKKFGTEEETYQRIHDFCGRYLNAARHGEDQLFQTFKESLPSDNWPAIWQSENDEDKQLAAAFGESHLGFSLFPFTQNSLDALADRYCRSTTDLEFNPRKILQHILREPLLRFRDQYAAGGFPPPEFAGVLCPGSLQAELRLKVREDLDRVETLAAIWGYGAETLAELAHLLPATIPAEFGLPNLTGILEKTTPKAPTRRIRQPTIVYGKGKIKIEPQAISIQQEPGLAIPRQVDEFFVNKSISQEVARLTRIALCEAIEARLGDYKDWYGMKKWPDLKVGKLPLIHIPYNANNPARTILEFGSEKEFSNKSRLLKFKQFIVAVWRRDKEAPATLQSWDYPNGTEDYCNYKNFLDDWIPEAMGQLVKLQRGFAATNLETNLTSAAVFEPQLSKATLVERIDCLVITSNQIKERIRVKTGLEDWDNFIEAQLTEWDKKQSLWLDSFSTNRHGLEGDLIRKVLRGITETSIPPKAEAATQKAKRAFDLEFPLLECLDGCTSNKEFVQSLQTLSDLVSKLSSTNQFKDMGGIVTTRTFKSRLKKIIEANIWPSIKCGLNLRQPFVAVNAINALQGINLPDISLMHDCLGFWSSFYNTNIQRMRNESAEHGAERRKKCEDEFDNLLLQYSVIISPSEDTT